MGAYRNLYKTPIGCPNLALRTMMLPQMGSSPLFGQMATLSHELHDNVKCRSASAKADFVRQKINSGVLDSSYLVLIGKGADDVALNIMTYDAVLHKGNKFSGNYSKLYDATTYQTLNALLANHQLNVTDVACQLKHLVESELATLEEIENFLITSKGCKNAMAGFLISHIERIVEPEDSKSKYPAFQFRFHSTRSHDVDADVVCDVVYQWDYSNVLYHTDIDYPLGNDNHSIHKRDLIDSIMAASQAIVLDFISPYEVLKGEAGGEDIFCISNHFEGQHPTKQQIIAYIMEYGDDPDEFMFDMPSFMNYCESQGVYIGEDNNRDDFLEALEVWAGEVHDVLELRRKLPATPLPEYLRSENGYDKIGIVNYLTQRIADASHNWPDNDANFIKVLQNWGEWLKERVINDEPKLTQDVLNIDSEMMYHNECSSAGQAFFVTPNVMPNLEYTMLDGAYQHHMEQGSFTGCKVINANRWQDMSDFIGSLQTLSRLMHFVESI